MNLEEGFEIVNLLIIHVEITIEYFSARLNQCEN